MIMHGTTTESGVTLPSNFGQGKQAQLAGKMAAGLVVPHQATYKEPIPTWWYVAGGVAVLGIVWAIFR